MKDFGQNLRLFLNLEHEIDVKDPMRILRKSGKWVVTHYKLREGQELETDTVIQETDYLQTMDDWVQVLTDWEAVRSGRRIEEAVRAQRAGEIAREVEAGMAMRQRERIQTEEAQNEVTRASIVDELQTIEKTAEGREKEEKTKEEEPQNQESIVDSNILMNQHVLDIDELNLIEDTLQNISRVLTSSRSRITTLGPLVRSSSSQTKRVHKDTIVSSVLKRSKESDFKLVVSAFGKTLQTITNVMTSSLNQFST